MVRRLARATFLAGLASCGVVHGQETGESDSASWLRVERSPGAEACYSARSLATETQGLLSKESQTHQVRVHFTRVNDAFVAKIRSEHLAEERILSDTHPDCRPLGMAVATALAFLFDPKSSLEASLGSPPPSTSDRPAMPVRASERQAFWLGFALHGGMLPGYASQPAALLEAGFAGQSDFAELQLLGRVIPATTEDHGGGQVTAQTVGARLSLCYRWPLHPWALGVCAAGAAGAVSVEASGFTESGGATRPDFTLDAGLRLSYRVGAPSHHLYQIELSGSPAVALTQESFVVEGIGNVFQRNPVFAQITLGVSYGISVTK